MAPNRQMRRLAAVGAALAVLALGACGSSDDGDSAGNDAKDTNAPANSGGGSGDQIVIKNFEFSPTPLTVKVGTTIKVKNDDSAAHTVTADDDSLDTGNLDAGASGTISATKAGDIAYHCEIHDYMKGVIRVEG